MYNPLLQALFGLSPFEELRGSWRCEVNGHSKQGTLCLTPSSIVFTTLFDGDLNGDSDVTRVMPLAKIRSVCPLHQHGTHQQEGIMLTVQVQCSMLASP